MSTLAFTAEAVIAVLILAAAFFLFVGSLGLATLPDMMRRLHAPTKATTLGIGGLLLASMIYFPVVEGSLSLHEPVITLFLVLTAPVTAQMLAKAHLLRNPQLREQLPETGCDARWATEPRSAGEAREV